MTIERALIGTTDAAAAASVYVEDVFSTYLYTGNSSTQAINNGIDLATKGGLVWCKSRSGADPAQNHMLGTTTLGTSGAAFLRSNTTGAAYGNGTQITAFNTNGFSLGAYSEGNAASTEFVSWTFRKQPKFFDVVTYTGNGANRTIAHSLGATPGMIIVKRTDTTSNWQVYHSGLTSAANSIQLNLTAAQASATTVWNSTAPTSSVFSVGTHADVNASGGTYVAYLYAASNSGGFGPAGTDSVVACGSFTTDGSGAATVNLGWEAQWVMVKRINGVGGWRMADTMRGASLTDTAIIDANTSAAESFAGAAAVYPTATGFGIGSYYTSEPIIYLAIRRPMKTPTDATKVFSLLTQSLASTANLDVNATFPSDTIITSLRGAATYMANRVAGSAYLTTTSTAAEGAGAPVFNADGTQNNVRWPSAGASNYISWNFKRAPGFFDVVCYTGTGSAMTISHNLGVVPEMIITKRRSGGTGGWYVYHVFTGANKYLGLDITNAATTYNQYYTTTPTSTNFAHGVDPEVTGSGSTYVAYLFATCPGVSKVGSYTGTGTTKQIDCGFSSGARFVLIKRTNSTGSWYVWDTARGLVSGNDPYLLLNSTAAEVTNTDYIDPYSAGFEISSTAPAEINASGGSYIYLAIA